MGAPNTSRLMIALWLALCLATVCTAGAEPKAELATEPPKSAAKGDSDLATEAEPEETTESLFIALAWGDNLGFLVLLAFMMGLGKGGVPGSSTSSVALNALHAPELPTMIGMPSGTDLAVAVQVTFTRNLPLKPH